MAVMQWYFEKDGKQIGPVEYYVIQQLIEAGQIDVNTMVWSNSPDRSKPEVPEHPVVTAPAKQSSKLPPPLPNAQKQATEATEASMSKSRVPPTLPPASPPPLPTVESKSSTPEPKPKPSGTPWWNTPGVVLLGAAIMYGNRQCNKPDSSSKKEGTSTTTRSPISKDVTVATLRMQWHDETASLTTFASQISPEQRALLGLAAIASGMDIYGARVNLTNTGNIPIRIFPQNILIHFGSQSATVYTCADFRFLQPCVLDPGQSTSGLVSFTASMDVGAAIRLGQGRMSYSDPSINVTDY